MHSHLVREQPKIVSKLYKQFAKFSKSEIQHFHKLEQPRKISNLDEAPRPRYNEIQHNYSKPMHNIDFDGCGPPENWEKNYETSSQQTHPRTFDQIFNQYSQRGGLVSWAVVVAEALIQSNLCSACSTVAKSTTAPEIAPSF
jgi:hypothetical protein